MTQLTASALIKAPAEKIYNIIADYHEGHPQILPKPPFVSLAVEEGGIGAGTIIFVEMKMLGQLQSFRATITEPEPGRVLVETNDTGYVTSFIVDPRADGASAQVTISTELNERAGLLGKLERWFVSRLLKPVYEEELEKLATLAMQTSGI